MSTITLKRGDSRSIPIEDFLEEDGVTPYLLAADDTVNFTVRDAGRNVLISKQSGGGGITYVPGTDNATVAIAPADTSPLTTGTYDFDVQLTQADGTVTTVDAGLCIITTDIT